MTRNPLDLTWEALPDTIPVALHGLPPAGKP